jgi:hypothetical protein
MRYIVDGSTVLFAGGNSPSLKNLRLLLDHLKKGDHRFEVFVDASIRHKLPEKEKGEYEELVRRGVIKQCPAGTAADEWILKRAMSVPDAKIITLDQYSDWREKYPIEDDRLVPFMIVGGKVFLKGEEAEEDPTETVGETMPETRPRLPFSPFSLACGIAGIVLSWYCTLFLALPQVQASVALGAEWSVRATAFLAMLLIATKLTKCFSLSRWNGLTLALASFALFLAAFQSRNNDYLYFLNFLYPSSTAAAAFSQMREGRAEKEVM